MRLIIEIDPKLKARIDRVLSVGAAYPSYHEFVYLAIRNQLTLEESPKQIAGTTPLFLESEKIDLSLNTATDELGMNLKLLAPPSSRPLTVKLKPLEHKRSEEPIFGMMNKIAAGKLALRVLANKIAEKGTAWIDIESVHPDLERNALLVKEHLRIYDKSHRRRRGEGLASGFPNHDRTSIRRYLNHYLGYLAKKSRSGRGLLAEMGLVSLDQKGDGTIMIGITEPGLRFCMMHSPLIDEAVLANEPILVPLSPEEVGFIGSQLKAYRPGELKFLRHVAHSVGNGQGTPDRLSKVVRAYLKAIRYGNISDAVVVTMRVGAVSKLSDMGILVTKMDRGGATYSLNEDAQRKLEATNA
jgi:hypothetical protein